MYLRRILSESESAHGRIQAGVSIFEALQTGKVGVEVEKICEVFFMGRMADVITLAERLRPWVGVGRVVSVHGRLKARRRGRMEAHAGVFEKSRIKICSCWLLEERAGYERAWVG